MKDRNGAMPMELRITDIQRYLTARHTGNGFALLATVGSTNVFLKSKQHILPSGFVTLAKEQTFGRGRNGKDFFSPKNSGLYMSVLYKDLGADSVDMLTVRVCLAVLHAIERLAPTKALKIKWVNDIYYATKKICGILCERTGQNVVVGIGIDLLPHASELPAELLHVVGSISDWKKEGVDPNHLAAEVLNELDCLLYGSTEWRSMLEEYRERSMLVGQPVTVIQQGKRTEAFAIGIDDHARLVVRYGDLTEEALSSGEVSIRV